MAPRRALPKSPAKAKKGAAAASLDKGRQLGLFESFARSPVKRRRVEADEAPLEVEAVPHVYDAFTVGLALFPR
jgi:hypothetical protein